MRTGGKQWKGTWTGGVWVDSASEQVDVRRLKQDEKARDRTIKGSSSFGNPSLQ